MRIPNADRAVVDIAKIRDYCLNPDHPRGRHKARVFHSALGLTRDHTRDLRDLLIHAVRSLDAESTESDDYGRRYVIDFMARGPAGSAMVRSAWIVLHIEDFPRLTSCYVL